MADHLDDFDALLTASQRAARALGVAEAEQRHAAIEGIAIIMLVYLTISLSISLFMNWYNSRIALVER